MPHVVVHELSKTYNKGQVLSLNKVNFEVGKGELFGLIGPDGAGKSTLFRILTTLLLPDSGTASIEGLHIETDYREIRKHLGYMPGTFSLYQDLSIEENLNFFASIFKTTVEKNYELIQDIYEQIEPFKTRRAGKLSGGMKQKLALCCALIHKPKVLLLDEPTTGVDAVSRKEFWDMLNRLKQKGITIIVSTPYMDEALQCERIALLQKGSILQVDTPKNIIKSYPKPLYAIRAEPMSLLLRTVRNYSDVESCFSFGDAHHVTLKTNEEASIARVDQQLHNAFGDEVCLQRIEPSIEDCFIRLMTAEKEEANQ